MEILEWIKDRLVDLRAVLQETMAIHRFTSPFWRYLKFWDGRFSRRFWTRRIEIGTNVTWVDNLRNMGKKCMSAIKYKILRVWWCIIFISQSRMWFSRHTHVLAWQVREGSEGSLCQPLSMCMIQIWPKRPWCPICRCTDMMPINTQRHIHVCAHLHIIYMYVTYVGISA